jgi:hypothetical protein
VEVNSAAGFTDNLFIGANCNDVNSVTSPLETSSRFEHEPARATGGCEMRMKINNRHRASY